MELHAMTGGFKAPPQDSAQAFRALLEAMARPGVRQQISGAQPPKPVSPAAGAVLLTLTDPNTPVYLAGEHDIEVVRDWITFQTNAPLVTRPSEADFALGTWDALMPLGDYPIGTPEYPDRSTTLIVERPALDGTRFRASGPGIETTQEIALPEADAFVLNAACYPLGLDFIFTSGAELMALPRTTRIEEMA